MRRMIREWLDRQDDDRIAEAAGRWVDAARWMFVGGLLGAIWMRDGFLYALFIAALTVAANRLASWGVPLITRRLMKMKG